MKNSANGVTKRLPTTLRIIEPSAPILKAVTVVRQDENEKALVVRLHDQSQAETLCNNIIETAIQSMLLREVSQFRTFTLSKHDIMVSSRPVSKAVAKAKGWPKKVIQTRLPMRSEELPRTWDSAQWVEAYVRGEKDAVVPNPRWEEAGYEMMIFTTPDLVAYSMAPIELIMDGPHDFHFAVSGDLTVLGKIEAIPVHRKFLDI